MNHVITPSKRANYDGTGRARPTSGSGCTAHTRHTAKGWDGDNAA